jgi:signal transduction histidine kinase
MQRDALMQRTVRLLATAVVLGALYALGALLVFWFLATPSLGSAFFPPAGLTLAALALTPRRTWPLWLVAAGTAEFFVDVTHHLTVPLALGFAVANTVEPLVGATTLRAATGRFGVRPRGALLAYLACAVVIGPFVGGLIGATVGAIWGDGGAWVTVFSNWWLGDALGVLVVASPILAWARPSAFEPNASLQEIALISALSVAVILVPGIVWHRPLIYVVLPLLVWAALRGGSRAATTVGFFVAFAADWVAVTGRADKLLAADSPTRHLEFVQLYLGMTLLTALVLCVEVAQRRRAEWILRRADADRIRAELAVHVAAGNERHRIARETHDIVGHAMNVMLLQAGAARRFISGDPERSRELLESLEATGRSAFGDLDRALGIGAREELQPERGLDAVPELVETMRDAGLAVELDVQGHGNGELSTLVEWSAYRILQEALTNVAKHAPAARVHVTIRHEPDALFLAVVNDRVATPARNGQRTGRGLVGMRERVAVLGGDIDVGPSDEGFAVRVRLPMPGVSA